MKQLALAFAGLLGAGVIAVTAGTAGAATDNPCQQQGAVINGTPASEVLVGTMGSDVINGLGGNDVLIGLGGEDVLRGGRGNDELRGGP